MAVTKLIIYNGGSAQGIAAAAVAANMYPYDGGTDVEIKDIDGITTGNIDTYLAGLSDNSFDKIIVACENEVAAATGKLTKTQLGTLYDKLKTANLPTAIDSKENSDQNAATTIGKTGAGWTVDEHIGRWVLITGGTGAGQLAKITDNTADTLTIGSDWDTTPDTDSDFSIIDPDDDGQDPSVDLDLREVGNTVGTKSNCVRVWDDLYPGITPPQVIFTIGDTRSSVARADADSVGNNTLTDSGAFASVDYEDYYVFIYSSTLGKFQIRQIESHTDDVLTLAYNWDTNPTGTITYRIYDDGLQVGYEKFFEVYITSYLSDLTDGEVIDEWTKILDMNQNADELKTGETPVQDHKHIEDVMVAKGKIICDYLASL